MVSFRTRSRNSRGSVIVLLIVGVVFLIVGIAIRNQQKSFAKTGVYTDAEVVNLVSHRSDNSITYRPEVKFTTKSGETVQVVHSSGSNPPRYKVGDKVEIIYAPDNPYHIAFNSTFELVIFPFIFIGVGVLCILLLLAKLRRMICPV